MNAKWKANGSMLMANGFTVGSAQNHETACELVQAANAFPALLEILTKIRDEWETKGGLSLATHHKVIDIVASFNQGASK